ncbi:MAG: glycosyltransferase family 4 protein [Euryarchaeota archaeon]|nr:glycosyltransferase family 4 protein [Euryarchaeota archaeon]
MKILELSNFFYPKISGSSRYCYELSRRLANNHEVTVLTTRYPKDLKKRETIEGMDVIRVKSLGLGWNISSLSCILPTLTKMAGNYDFVHLHSYLFLISNQAGFLRLFKKFPLYLHLHGGLGAPALGGLKPIIKKYLYDPIVLNLMLKASDKILSISRDDIAGMKNAFWVPNGVETNEFPFIRREHEKLNVGYIGRLEKWKGVHHLPYIIKKVKKERDVNFHIVGGGPLQPYLEKNCDAEFYGRVPFAEVPEIMKKIDLLILPSLIEGVPTVILEAFSSGAPAIARDVGSVSELVSEENGFLVETNDEFVEKILHLADNRDLIPTMGKKGRKLVEEYYAWEKVVERFEAVL